MPQTTFTATTKLLEGLQVENSVRHFTVRMDEPESLGGTDTGMNPVEAMLAALGSCITIVAAAFAQSEGIDLQEFWVESEGDLDPSGFLKGAEGVRRGFNEVRFTPHIKTSSSPEEVEKFMTFIKSRCPVTDNMVNATQVVSATPVME
ncbi:MAG TPA: OsmC family protein [Alkalispirochaeta sp.]|nr:OsmC family protein [Alkalispirochaeta sp.]